MNKVFCSHCGNKTLKKLAVTVSEDGSVQMHFSKNPKVLNPKGLKVRERHKEPLKYRIILLFSVSCSLFCSMMNSLWCFSTRCRCLREGNTPRTPTWWRTSVSPSRDSLVKLVRRPTSSTRTTWPERHRSVRTISTVEPPTSRSETVSVAAAADEPTPTPPARSL